LDREEAKKLACQVVDEVQCGLIELSDRIHANPEIKHEEYKACEWHAEYLKQMGFDVKTQVGGIKTSFAATRKVGEGGPKIAFLGEYDALPGIGHACGHNVIGAAADGAGIALVRALEKLGVPVTVTVFGCPGEEGGGGKVYMANAGCFKGYDAAIMMHPGDRNATGKTSNTSGRWAFRFYGKSAHGAGSPHLGINALDGVLQTFNMVNGLRQMMTDDVRIMGIITNGGQAVNAIPEFAECWFSIRAARLDTHRKVMDRVKKCAEAAAAATGTRLEAEEPEHYPHYPVRVNQTLNKVLGANLEKLVGVVDYSTEGGKGSTDFGNVSWQMPGVHGTIAIAPKGTAGHSTELRDAAGSEGGHKGLVTAAKAMAMSGVDLVFEPCILKETWEEYEASQKEGR